MIKLVYGSWINTYITSRQRAILWAKCLSRESSLLEIYLQPTLYRTHQTISLQRTWYPAIFMVTSDWPNRRAVITHLHDTGRVVWNIRFFFILLFPDVRWSLLLTLSSLPWRFTGRFNYRRADLAQWHTLVHDIVFYGITWDSGPTVDAWGRGERSMTL